MAGSGASRILTVEGVKKFSKTTNKQINNASSVNSPAGKVRAKDDVPVLEITAILIFLN